MDGAKLQSKVYACYAKAAKVIGLPFDVYRMGQGPTTLFSDANKVDSLLAQFTMASTIGAFLRAPKVDETWFDALLDGRRVHPGDVLVHPTVGTFFILSMAPLLPIKAGRCNDAITITRARAPVDLAVGDLGYFGHLATTAPSAASGEDIIWSSVPCASSSEGYGRATSQGLTASDSPGPTKWFFYLPPYVPAGAIRDRDIVTDSLGNRYQVAAANWVAFALALQCVRLQT